MLLIFYLMLLARLIFNAFYEFKYCKSQKVELLNFTGLQQADEFPYTPMTGKYSTRYI